MLVYFFSLPRLHAPLNQYAELERMLALRSMGMSYNDLAKEFNVPRDTIIYLARRFNLGGAMQPPVPKSRTTSIPSPASYNDETINHGKTYKEYMQDDKNRRWRRLTATHL